MPFIRHFSLSSYFTPTGVIWGHGDLISILKENGIQQNSFIKIWDICWLLKDKNMKFLAYKISHIDPLFLLLPHSIVKKENWDWYLNPPKDTLINGTEVPLIVKLKLHFLRTFFSFSIFYLFQLHYPISSPCLF